MRRSPEEDHQEEDERWPRQRPGDCGPADEHRHTPRDAAPDDVLGGPTLEQDGVEDDIERNRAEREGRADAVDEEGQPQDRSHAEHDPEDHGVTR